MGQNLTDVDNRSATTTFDLFADEAIDHYIALPVDETFLTLLRQSFDDVRSLLEGVTYI